MIDIESGNGAGQWMEMNHPLTGSLPCPSDDFVMGAGHVALSERVSRNTYFLTPDLSSLEEQAHLLTANPRRFYAAPSFDEPAPATYDARVVANSAQANTVPQTDAWQ